eukprot:Lankesteria_metandrocarpae@DN3505_c0_g1_i1.p1
MCTPTSCGNGAYCLGGTECACQPGYLGDPSTGCYRDNCSEDDACGDHALCKNVRNSYECKCEPGFVGNPFIKCELDCAACTGDGKDGTCTKTKDGVLTCGCKKEYKSTGPLTCTRYMCTPTSCGNGAYCLGGTECACQPGYLGDPSTGCYRDNCSEDDACGDHALCKNVRNSYECKCEPGFVGNPFIKCELDCAACTGDGKDGTCTKTKDGVLTCGCKKEYKSTGPLTCTRYMCTPTSC